MNARVWWLWLLLAACSDRSPAELPDAGPPGDGPQGPSFAKLKVKVTGKGEVDAPEISIYCGFACSTTLPTGRRITLTAAPGHGATFAGWGGPCTGTDPTCTFTLPGGSDETEVTAEFAGGCEDECTEGSSECMTEDTQRACGNFDDDSCLEWGEPTRCAGAETCTYSHCGDYHALAVVPLPLDGQIGTITSTPEAIECGVGGELCERSFIDGYQITLTATSDADATFDGWALLPFGQTNGMACVGSTAPCTVTMSEATTLAARYCTSACPAGGVRCSGNTDVIETCGQFDDDRCTEFGPAVTCPAGELCTLDGCAAGAIATATASGRGKVAIDGVTCAEASCTQGVAAGKTAQITAVAEPSTVLAGWSGACSGTGACAIAGGATATAAFADRCAESVLVTFPQVFVDNAVAVGPTDLYWTDRTAGALRRRPLAGGATTTISTSPPPFDLVSDATHLYWLSNDSYEHNRSELRRFGPGGEELLLRSANNELYGAMAISPTHIYFHDGTELRRMPKAGGASELIASNLDMAGYGGMRIATDATHVYWIDRVGTLKRAPLAGGASEQLSAALNPYSEHLQNEGLALDADHVYWSQIGRHRIVRVAKTGGPIETVVNNTFAFTLAIDGDTLLWSSDGIWATRLGSGVITQLSRRNAGQGLAVTRDAVFYAAGDAQAAVLATVPRTTTCAPTP